MRSLHLSARAVTVEETPAIQVDARSRTLPGLRQLFPYGLAFILPILTLTFLGTGPHRGPASMLWLLVLPLLVSLDRLMGRGRPDAASSDSGGGFTVLLYGLALLQGANILIAVGRTFQGALSLPEAVTAITLLGASSAHTLLVAHELIHKARRGTRVLGRVLLWTLLYDHFYTEHLRGHHVRAGTEEDPSTAFYDEPFWPYLRRAWHGEWRSAWHLEIRRLATNGPASWLRNTVLHGAAAQLAMLLLMGLLAGGYAVIVFVAQAVLAQLLIQVVNYLEHWGIQRGTRTRASATDSWESESLFTQFALLGLARHADHHLKVARPYQRLAWHAESPCMPRGHIAMIALVLFQNRRVRQLLAEELRRKGLAPVRT